mgnify:CR=1 FL=1
MNEQIIAYLKDQGLTEQQIKDFLSMLETTPIEVVESKSSTWEKETDIKEQQLIKQERIGYTAVEWGGVIHN